VQFDVIDKFDMFDNPHDDADYTDEQDQMTRQLYNRKYPQTEACFAPGSKSVDIYFSYVSALQTLFVRNYDQHHTLLRIGLMHFPTTMKLIDCSKMYIDYTGERKPNFYDTLACIGTKEGKVLVYKVGVGLCESKLLFTTKSGCIFGEVAAVSVQESGQQMVASSTTGEIMTFELNKTITEIEAEEDKKSKFP